MTFAIGLTALIQARRVLSDTTPKKSTTPTCPAGICVKNWSKARTPNALAARTLPRAIGRYVTFCRACFAAFRQTKRATIVMSTDRMNNMMDSLFQYVCTNRSWSGDYQFQSDSLLVRSAVSLYAGSLKNSSISIVLVQGTVHGTLVRYRSRHPTPPSLSSASLCLTVSIWQRCCSARWTILFFTRHSGSND
jgi:hypothetical protein